MNDELPMAGCAGYSALISLLQTHPSRLGSFILGLGPLSFLHSLASGSLLGSVNKGH